jgi:hypothetical protein
VRGTGRPGVRRPTGAIVQLATRPPAGRVVGCLDELGPAAAKSFPGRQPVPRRPPDQPAVRAAQEIDSGRRGPGYVVAAFQPKDAAYLNLIEPWWTTRRSLARKGRRFQTWADVAPAIAAATADWTSDRQPSRWGHRRRHCPRRPRPLPERRLISPDAPLRRVPTPGGPTSVSRRTSGSHSRAHTAVISSSRPMSRLGWRGSWNAPADMCRL